MLYNFDFATSHSTGFFLKKKVYKKIGIYDTNFKFSADYDLYFRLYKEKYTGATVHLVNSKLDSGKIITQKKIIVLKKDNKKSLEKKILKIEHKIYPEAIKILLTNY